MLTEFSQVIVPSAVFWVLVTAPTLVQLPRRESQSGLPSETPVADPAEVFWQKLPSELGPDLVALSAELHYLRVEKWAAPAGQPTPSKGFEIRHGGASALKPLVRLFHGSDGTLAQRDRVIRAATSRSADHGNKLAGRNWATLARFGLVSQWPI